MNITEKDRLDLRQELERVLANERLAEIAMEAMPPIDYDRLATKDDVYDLGRELRGEMAELRSDLQGQMIELRSDLRGEMIELRSELRGEMAELRSELRGEMAELRSEVKLEIVGVRAEIVSTARMMMVAQLTTMVMLGGWVAAVA